MLLSGCATMHYPKTYKVEGKEVREFKELDDDKALKLVVLIYNVKHEEWKESIARSIALQEYIRLLAKRRSAYLKKSGIFEVKYDKVKLKTWKDPDLIKLYESLTPKAEIYYVEAAPQLSDVQNAERIMYLTAMSAIDTEMKKRDNTRNVVSIASQVLIGALTVALSML
jgi:hypothetical protein